jgi:flagellin
LESQNDFASRLGDIQNQGLGNLVDADLGEESANLIAEQVKQELGLKSLAISNAGPKALLSLFA